MKMVEIRYASQVKELEKLSAKLERAEKAYTRKLELAKKHGVDTMDDEEHREWIKAVPKTETGYLINKEDIKKNTAWFDLYAAEREVEDVKRRIENAEKRIAKAEQEVAEYYEEIQKIEDLKKMEELFKAKFEQEQKEWKKDGIILEGRYYGTTPKGKRFWIEGNNGWTRRSLHCYTLYIDRQVVFTSGEFWRAYGVVRNS